MTQARHPAYLLQARACHVHAIYLLSLAEMTGVDLQDQIEAKIARNAARTYRRLPNGFLVKDPDQA